MAAMLSRLTDGLYNALLPTTDPYAPHHDVTMEGALVVFSIILQSSNFIDCQ